MAETKADTWLEKQQTIGSYLGKLLREHFGKGPESVSVSLGGTCATIYLRQFLAPMERVLLEREQEEIVSQLRQKMMETLLPEIRQKLEAVTGQTFTEFYNDWSWPNRSGMIVGVCREKLGAVEGVNESFEGQSRLEAVIEQVSLDAQKSPAKITTCELNARTVTVVREGVLTRLERELLEAGHSDLLRRVKKRMEKELLLDGRLNGVLPRRVTEAFVDWDFERDKSVIVLICDPRRG